MAKKKRFNWFELLLTIFIILMMLVALAFLVPDLWWKLISWNSQRTPVIQEESLEMESETEEELVVSLPINSDELGMKNLDEVPLIGGPDQEQLALQLALDDQLTDRLGYLFFMTGLNTDTAALLAEEREVMLESLPKVVLPVTQPQMEIGTWLINEKIGLDADVYRGEDMAIGLDRGVVMVPGYGEIGRVGSGPVIMAAHRFGLRWWEPGYATRNSFYNLPKLAVGDQLIVWEDQREWRYEITGMYEGEEIIDYNHDLIVYTCRFLNSDVRYFVTAELVDPASYGEVEIYDQSAFN